MLFSFMTYTKCYCNNIYWLSFCVVTSTLIAISVNSYSVTQIRCICSKPMLPSVDTSSDLATETVPPTGASVTGRRRPRLVEPQSPASAVGRRTGRQWVGCLSSSACAQAGSETTCSCPAATQSVTCLPCAFFLNDR